MGTSISLNALRTTGEIFDIGEIRGARAGPEEVEIGAPSVSSDVRATASYPTSRLGSENITGRLAVWTVDDFLSTIGCFITSEAGPLGLFLTFHETT